MKKKTPAYALLCLLLATIIGLGFMDIANANFVGPTTRPKVVANIFFPVNNTIYDQDKLRLSYSAEIEDWTDPVLGHMHLRYVSASCYLDNELVNNYISSSFSTLYCTLENLTDGEHEAKVTVSSYYEPLGSGYDSSSVYFAIQMPTKTSSPTNQSTPTATPSTIPTPSPSPAISSTPTQAPTSTLTLEPSITSKPIIDNNSTLAILVIAIPFLFLIVGLAFYFRKRRK